MMKDCLQWLIDQSATYGDTSVPRIAQKFLGFVFAFAHQIAMVCVTWLSGILTRIDNVLVVDICHP